MLLLAMNGILVPSEGRGHQLRRRQPQEDPQVHGSRMRRREGLLVVVVVVVRQFTREMKIDD
jgi:hypothetical protein